MSTDSAQEIKSCGQIKGSLDNGGSLVFAAGGCENLALIQRLQADLSFAIASRESLASQFRALHADLETARAAVEGQKQHIAKVWADLEHTRQIVAAAQALRTVTVASGNWRPVDRAAFDHLQSLLVGLDAADVPAEVKP